jgi:hypothetical protein
VRSTVVLTNAAALKEKIDDSGGWRRRKVMERR